MPSGDPEPPHVGDVEEAAAGPGPDVFVPDRTVVERKLPAGVIDHFRPVLDVEVVERGTRCGGVGGHLRTVAVRSVRRHLPEITESLPILRIVPVVPAEKPRIDGSRLAS